MTPGPLDRLGVVPMTPPRRPRLTDVAEVADVSMKTVSNVINGYAHVSSATRERVLAAVEQIGYRPNLSARNLARGRSGFIALVVPRLEMPYFAALAACVVEAAEEQGWFVLMHQTDGDSHAELAALEGRFPQRIDGLIVSSQHLVADHFRSRMDQTPLVMLGDHDFGPDVPHVGIDNVKAGRLAVRHLEATGSRRIAIVGAAQADRHQLRARGFVEGLRDAGLPVTPELMRPVAANTGDEGERVTEEMLREVDTPPDGIFAVTDWLAFGVMRALHRYGLRVPDEAGVVGFDDIPYARSITPSLTSIAPDREAIATRAVALLADQLDDRPLTTPRRDRAGFRLIVRESTRG